MYNYTYDHGGVLSAAHDIALPRLGKIVGNHDCSHRGCDPPWSRQKLGLVVHETLHSLTGKITIMTQALPSHPQLLGGDPSYVCDQVA